MRKTIAAALAAFTFAGAVASAAQAHDTGRRHRHNDDGAAIAAGIAGLAIGAALASSSRDRGYYDRRYYDRGYYGGGHYAPRYYDRGYYGPPVRYGYYEPRRRHYSRTCRTYSRWDPYYGGYVRVRRCW
ncbi:MAG: hypothetical protein ACK41C_09345 [Phenylobacterium sp.]|jgi:hypothetical protein|uniref:hypothetical protein n=1 Tax=Phenylobacterium sp. TaxID=1871053 RepID=UPI00391A2218